MVRKERLELSHLGRQNLNLVRLPISPLPHNGVRNGARTHDNRNHNPGLYQLSYSHHTVLFFVDGVPYRIRTCDPLLRRQSRYPSAPLGHIARDVIRIPSRENLRTNIASYLCFQETLERDVRRLR